MSNGPQCALRAAFTVALVVLSVTGAKAQQQGLSLTYSTNYPNNQVIFGCSVNYSITGTPPPNTQIKGVQWRYQQTVQNCTSPWSGWVQGNMSQSYYETRVGAFTVQAQVTLQEQPSPQNPNPPVTTQILSVNVTVPPPDDFKLPNPSTINIPLNQDFQVAFQVTCKGQDVCMLQNVVRVKEDLLGLIFLGQKLGDKLDFGQPNLLFTQGTMIMDIKGVTIDPAIFKQARPGQSVARYSQKLYLIISDLCGNQTRYPLNKVIKVNHVKFDDNTVQLIIGQ